MAKMVDAEKVKKVFKAYDVRGRVPELLDADLVSGIGRAYATFVKPKRVAVGHDARLTSPELVSALTQSLRECGCEVIDLGMCGTEQVYFATFHLKLDGGIMVTASHNPAQDNGMKFVREDAKPISSDTGLKQMAQVLIADDLIGKKWLSAKRVERDIMADYLDHILKMVEEEHFKPHKVVFNCCNGSAGKTLDALLARLPFQAVHLLHEADGNFPHGSPNPLAPEMQRLTAEAIIQEQANCGIAFDGDFDRCFFFDEKGKFIESYYLVGLFATRFLDCFPGERIIHDPRLVWDTLDVVEKNSGIAIQNRSGHAFMKARMRTEHAVFGGETSGHYYFRDFGFCDSGMLPFLIMMEMLGKTGKKLSDLVLTRQNLFPISGEINRDLKEPEAAMARVREKYERAALKVDEMDGVSFEFKDWRFNLRLSNTEALIRLNVETRGNQNLLREKTAEVLNELK